MSSSPNTESSSSSSSCWQVFSSHAKLHYDLMKNHLYGFYLPNFGISVATAVFNTLIPISLRDQNQTDTTIGWIVALVGIGRLVSEIPISLSSLKFGPWIVMLVSMVAAILAYLVPTIFPQTTWSFIVAQAVGGIAMCGFATPRSECLQVVFKKAERSRVSGHMGAMARVSFLIAPASAGAIYQHLGPSYAYLLGLVFFFLALVCVFSEEMIAVDLQLREKHAEEEAKKNSNNQETNESTEAPLLINDSSKNREAEDIESNLSDAELHSRFGDRDDEESSSSSTSLQRTHQNITSSASSSSTPALSLMGATPSTIQFPLVSSSSSNDDESHTKSNKRKRNGNNSNNHNDQQHKDLDEQHFSSPLEALKVHWKAVLGVGFVVLTVMSIRQARRLTITLRALNLGYDPRDVGIILAGSFAVDTIFFWVSSLVVNKWGYSWALAPLCFNYCLGFVLEGFEPSNGSPWTLFASLPLFGIGDSFGAGIVLALISHSVPRSLIGTTRLSVDGGMLLGPILCGFLSHQFSLSVCCFVMAAWSLVGAVASFVFIKKGAGKQG